MADFQDTVAHVFTHNQWRSIPSFVLRLILDYYSFLEQWKIQKTSLCVTYEEQIPLKMAGTEHYFWFTFDRLGMIEISIQNDVNHLLCSADIIDERRYTFTIYCFFLGQQSGLFWSLAPGHHSKLLNYDELDKIKDSQRMILPFKHNKAHFKICTSPSMSMLFSHKCASI